MEIYWNKESVYIGKELNSLRIGLAPFHYFGNTNMDAMHDVMYIRSLHCFLFIAIMDVNSVKFQIVV